MQKKLILLIIPLLLLTGCQNKNDELFTTQEEKVKEELKETSSITEEAIKEKYDYLKNNYESYDKSKKEAFIYNAKFLQTVGNNEDNELTTLADLILAYVKDTNNKNYEKVNLQFKNIESKETTLIKEMYKSYMVNTFVKEIINNKRAEVTADLNDKTLLTSKNITKGIEYIEKNIEDPFKNNEVIENLVYYSMYFDGLSTKGKIKTLGTTTLSYLKTLNDDKHTEIINLLNKMDRTKEINKIIK